MKTKKSPVKVKGFTTIFEVFTTPNYLSKLQERFRKYDLKK